MEIIEITGFENSRGKNMDTIDKNTEVTRADFSETTPEAISGLPLFFLSTSISATWFKT